MTERLKDLIFSHKCIRELGESIKEVYPDFDLAMFKHLVFADDWEGKELKQMMHHITKCMAETMPEDYPAALQILTEIARKHSFKDMSIRKHYPGRHQFVIKINGLEKAAENVDLF